MMTDNEINNIAQGDALKAIQHMYNRKADRIALAKSVNEQNSAMRKQGGFPSENIHVSYEEIEYVRDVGWLLTKTKKLHEREAYERNRADTLAEENAGFVEEAEKYARLVARIIKALGKEWREETDDDAEPIALGAIAKLQAERDTLRAAMKAIQQMADDELSHHGMLPMSLVPQIEADARAALEVKA